MRCRSVLAAALALPLLSAGAQAGFFGIRGGHSNDTGGIIPWSPEIAHTYRDIGRRSARAGTSSRSSPASTGCTETMSGSRATTRAATTRARPAGAGTSDLRITSDLRMEPSNEPPWRRCGCTRQCEVAPPGIALPHGRPARRRAGARPRAFGLRQMRRFLLAAGLVQKRAAAELGRVLVSAPGRKTYEKFPAGNYARSIPQLC
jgi:hypothetical protein